jgi:galactokinase
MKPSPPANFFTSKSPVFVARAPGRLDVMGGIADYSGSLVLQLPIDRHTIAMLQPYSEPWLDILTVRDGRQFRASLPLDEFMESTPKSLAARYPADDSDHWASYVFGVAYACLVRNAAHAPGASRGFKMFIESNIPEGKGVSSSAALEVSSLAAIAAGFDVELSAEEIAFAGQWAENHVAGAPCGIMDQMTSACGRRDHLLRLRCQPATIEGHVAIPPGFRFFGVDSGIRHAVAGADYGTVRAAAFMGYRMIASLAGFDVEPDDDRVRVHDDRWHGYLANIPPEYFVEHFASALPLRMKGADFLAQFGGITDHVTRVQPDRSYPVRVATAHPVRENARVEQFATLLGELNDRRDAANEMGALMAASHFSYSACGLGSDGTDRIVELVVQAGEARGLYGAKITGGGSGGTVAVFGTEGSESAIREIARRYESETGRRAEVFARSGQGMAECGVSRLK